MSDATDDADTRCRLEVEDLHRFFQDWFLGRLPDTEDAFARFAGVLADDFEMVPPDASRTSRAPLLRHLRRAHAFQSGQSETFRIRIDNVRSRRIADSVHLVTYEEWQRSGAGEAGRLSTAILRDHAGAPHALHWVHVHETWIPGAAS